MRIFKEVECSGTICLPKLCKFSPCSAELLFDFLSGRIRDGAGWIVRLGVIIRKGVYQELLAHVFKEILLPPPSEHSIRNMDIAQIPSARKDGSLMPIFKTCNLAKPELPCQESYSLIIQPVLHLATIQFRFSKNKPIFSNSANSTFAIGKKVKIQGHDFLEELGAPSASIKNNRDTSIGTDQFASLFKNGKKHFRHRVIGFSRNNKKRIAGTIIEPIISSGRNCKASPGIVSLGNLSFSVIDTYMSVEIEKADQSPSFANAVFRHLPAQI